MVKKKKKRIKKSGNQVALFWGRRKKLCISLLLATGVILSILLFDPKLGTGGDNALYIILARALSSGQGFSNIHQANCPPHTLVPPGYPLLLVPLVAIFPESFIPLKLLSVAFFIGSILLTYLLLKNYVGYLAAFIVSLFMAIAPFLLDLSHTILSELPCLFFILLSFFLEFVFESTF